MPLPSIDEYPAAYQYRFCPRCGGPLIRRTDDHFARLACPADGWTFYPTPSLAATVVIEHPDGLVLLKRAIEPDAGIWHLPIGHLEYGEPPAAAAAREAEEETGLAVGEVALLDLHHGPSYGDPRMFYLVFCYRAVATGTPRTDAENEAVRIFPPDHLPPIKWTSQQRALAAWRAWKMGAVWVPDRPYPLA